VRSLLLPIVAVALNLLTIAAAFGALQVFFGLNLLDGPRYIDAISAAGVLTIMFVLSIDYEVFLLTRMREAWLEKHDHIYAIEDGLKHTAGIITGAAVIMSSVFLAFATTDIANLQQFGAGLTFAVVLDATVIRVVLLPAIMRLLGPRAWWLPEWLDRLLPHIDHGGGPATKRGATEPAVAGTGPALAMAGGPAPLITGRGPAPFMTSAPLRALRAPFRARSAGLRATAPPDIETFPEEIPLANAQGSAEATPPATAEGSSAVEEFEAVAHAEHRRMLELLAALEMASGARSTDRILRLVRELRAVAVPHFRYEQRALFPQLTSALGPDEVEGLYVTQDETVAALNRIEALAEPGPMDQSKAAEARRLVRAARASVVTCDAVCDEVELQTADAERVLAARERVLSAA
jgi:hypothetical protein